MFPGFAGADVAVQDGAERAMDVTDVGFIESSRRGLRWA